MMTKKKKSQKPIEIDAHFRYSCPNKKCGYSHWLSLKETQAKNFKVVCDCGRMFSPKQILDLKIIYKKEPLPKTEKTEEKPPIIPVVEEVKQTLPVDKQKQCAKVLVGYGFTDKEANILIEKAFQLNPITEVGSLLKYILANLEKLN